ARPDPIHPGHVEAVAPDLLEPAVLIAVARQLRVAVELAAQRLIRLPADGRSVAPDAPDLLELVRVDRRGGAVSSGARAAERRLLRAAVIGEVHGEEVASGRRQRPLRAPVPGEDC